MRRIRVVFLSCLSLLLPACWKPQVVVPFNQGFVPDEFIATAVTGKDELGRLYEATQLFGSKNEPLPLSWAPSPFVLFPQDNAINQVVEEPFDSTRVAVETVSGNSKLAISSVVNVSLAGSSAFKYQAKLEKATRFYFAQVDQPLKYSRTVKDYIEQQVKKDSNYRFSYLSALYDGTSFLEELKKVESAGSGNFAAFEIGGNYYMTENRGTNTKGKVILQLTRVTLDQLNGLGPKPPHNLAPM